jgi:hypothetical protein
LFTALKGSLSRNCVKKTQSYQKTGTLPCGRPRRFAGVKLAVKEVFIMIITLWKFGNSPSFVKLKIRDYDKFTGIIGA